MSGAESEDDWFDKDEEELLQNLENKLTADTTIEYIKVPSNLTAQRVAAANKAQSAAEVSRIDITKLRKLARSAALETFLVAFSDKTANFFVSQILPNDSQERVLLYLRCFAAICSLRLPGYHSELLSHFAANEDFLDQLQLVTTQIFSKNQALLSRNLKVEAQILCDLYLLCLEAVRENIWSVKYRSMLQFMHALFKRNQKTHKIAELKIFQQLMQQLDILFSEEGNSIGKTQTNPDEIYPTLQELLEQPEPTKPLPAVDTDVRLYIEQQKYILRHDFLYSLRCCVQTLRTGGELAANLLLLEPVTIVYNTQFESAERHKLVFVDLLAGNRADANITIKPIITSVINRLKYGTLLCFSSSRTFDNLILATYNYTEQEVLDEAYISIEVLRQYNVGNIYNKPLLMFESPEFFEPYHQVYKSLSYKTEELPFQNYILAKEKTVNKPLYLRNKHAKYTFEGYSFKPNAELSTEALQLNAAQAKAYQNALTQELCVVHGPPGTGKTHMSVKLVRTLMENATHTPIVLITFTNESLDKFLLKLSEHTQDILRFGKRTRLPEISAMTTQQQEDEHLLLPHLKRLYYMTNMELKQRFKYLQDLQAEFDGTDEHYEHIVAAQHLVSIVEKKLNCLRIIFQYYLARNKRLIAMTTSCAAKMNLIFYLLKSAIVIFEEAAEIFESHVIACITPHTQHIIMIGDHKQLQPFTSSELSKAWSLNVSLFERLIEQGLPYTELNIQYRMSANIAQLLTPLFYKQLENAECVKNYAAVRQMRSNLFFMTHQQPETNDETSVCNEFEAVQLLQLADYLFNKANYTASDIVILSPYAKQVELIRRKLKFSAANLQDIRVSTVDSFQGLEANIVLLSLVRSNKQSNIGFLKNKGRICVALSRARLGLFIIGDLNFLAANSNTWCAIETLLKQQNAIGNQFPFEME